MRLHTKIGGSDTEFNLHRWHSRWPSPTCWNHLQRTDDSKKLARFSRLGHSFTYPPVLDAKFFISMAISQGKPRKELPWNSLGLKAKRTWSSCYFFFFRTGWSFLHSLAWVPKCWEMVKLERATPSHPAWQQRTLSRMCVLPNSCFCFSLICSGFGWDPRVHLLQNIC